MIYRVLQFLMRLSLSAHYKRIFLEGKKHFNSEQPLLIAATHPNSFLDAIILGSVIDRPLHFLARSDVFNTRLSNYILRKLNLIPIYRIQEGHENLNKNDQTFKACFELLEQNQAVLIFAEGVSLTDRIVRKPKKGLARIGFGAENRNQFKLNTLVQPIGINYEEATGFGNRVLIHFTKPFAVQDFKASYDKNSNLGFESLNETLYQSLVESTVIVEEEDDQFFEYLSHQLPDHLFRLKSLKMIAQKINRLKVEDEKTLNLFKESALLLESNFGKSHLNLRNFERKQNLRILWLILYFSFAILGYLGNRLPFLLGQIIAKKTVTLPEFFASVKLAVSTLIWLIYSWGISIYLAIEFTPYFLLLPLVLFMLGKGYQRYSKEWQEASARLNRRKIDKLDESHPVKIAFGLVEVFMQDLSD